MRLTLRTLLAYLDDTVDPADAEALRQKLQQSGFATQLVAAIRASIHAKSVSAPAPDSVHPIEEPNMMSEYLDSTLSPEQIAEVERSCLESEVNLAEAAACHQILTMILGKPANPSEAIKSRIYEMVDVSGNVVADFGNRPSSPIAGEIGPRGGFGIPIPSKASAGDEPEQAFTASAEDAIDREAETLDAQQAGSFDGLSMDSPTPVPPVGVDDSGVFDAPTKLRKQTFATPDAGATLNETERPLNALERSDFYEGDVRPSRITPWLVSLALAGVLLFAIAQIFQPLLRSRVAQRSDDEKLVNDADVEVEDTPPVLSADADEDEIPASEEWTDGPPPIPVDVTETIPPGSASQGTDSDDGSDSVVEMLPAPDAEPIPSVTLPPELPAEMVAPATAVADDSPQPSELPAGDVASSKTNEMVGVETPTPLPDSGPAETKPSVEPKPTAEEPAMESVVVATFESSSALVGVAAADETWKLLPPDSDVASGTTLVCGPEYRADFRFAGEGSANERNLITLVGPTKAQWLFENGSTGLGLSCGRGILTSIASDTEFTLTANGVTFTVSANEAGAILAFELEFLREIGDNPLIPENHSSKLKLVSVKGDHEIAMLGTATSLGIAQQATWTFDGDDPDVAVVETLEAPPAWVDADVDTGSLEAEAASTLLELLRGESSESLALSLRVALDFRRNEVAALAGKTMLAIGDGSSYFGIDGLLSNPDQRLYWSSHLDALRDLVDRSPEDAMLVRKAIAGNEAMDNADGDILFRLLVGFSQAQLESGEDAKLVEALESGSMAVRVLASENLRDITGKTLYFKPDEAVASRRSEVIKKWNVNLRRGQIRWPEPQAVEDAEPEAAEKSKAEALEGAKPAAPEEAKPVAEDAGEPDTP